MAETRSIRGLGGSSREYTYVVKPAETSTIAPSSPTGPIPSTSAESPVPRSPPGVSGSIQGGRCCIIQKICASAFSAIVSGSARTAISRRSGGTTFM